MSDVIVGVDPHKKSVTIEVVDGQDRKLATGRFGTTTRDYKAMLGYVRQQWPHHRWAIEGAQGVRTPGFVEADDPEGSGSCLHHGSIPRS